MNQHKIDILIVKVFENSITDEESKVLEDWLKEDCNKRYFNEFVQINYLINSKSQFDYTTSLKKFKIIINKKKFKIIINKSSQKNYTKYLKYAAAVLILISTSYFVTKDQAWVDENGYVETHLEIGTDKATLTLKDGSEVVLGEGNVYSSKTANSDGEKIIYKETQNNAKETKNNIAYNYLTIPRGGEYSVKLSDGTQVWLNSESKLKYPVNFIEGETRELELVYGEAYFDVSPSVKHKGSKFKVYSPSQEVEVFGTEFNIKAYKDENITYTTLVEGKVGVVVRGGVKQNLTPNQQLSFDITTEQVDVSVIDVYNEISWKDGVFSFEDKPLEDIMKVLSRWYDLEVVFENETIKKEEFFGLLRKDQKIENIVADIKESGIIKEYEFKDKILRLK